MLIFLRFSRFVKVYNYWNTSLVFHHFCLCLDLQNGDLGYFSNIGMGMISCVLSFLIYLYVVTPPSFEFLLKMETTSLCPRTT